MNVNLPSWSVAPMPSAQALAYVYFEGSRARRPGRGPSAHPRREPESDAGTVTHVTHVTHSP
jgi:hypothetical protein